MSRLSKSFQSTQFGNRKSNPSQCLSTQEIKLSTIKLPLYIKIPEMTIKDEQNNNKRKLNECGT